ncbi:LysR substrate-binding domain-containing protein [Ferrovibrio sp.]|uniref:LysR substrate-binding domain-containing protein n=1 Tax=Ferrovibrio sp. TaxID=1917215 RepID=UPI0035182996
MTSNRTLPPLLALRAFESAARHLSFSKAAEELCVTQSAVSRHIKNLEETFECELFLRRGRAVILSAEGKQLYERISIGFSLIEEGSKQLLNRRNDSVLRLNVLPTLGMRWLAPRLHRFSQYYPDAEIHLISSIEAVDFNDNQVDVAIRVGKFEGESENESFCHAKHAGDETGADLAKIDLEMLADVEGIEGQRLFADKLVAVCNSRLLTPPSRPEDLVKFPLITTLTRASAWDDWCRIGGLPPIAARKKLSFGHFFMSLQAALEGKGIAVLPEVLIEQELALGNLQSLFHKAASAGEYYLLYRKREAESRKVRLFRQWLTEEAKEYRRTNE